MAASWFARLFPALSTPSRTSRRPKRAQLEIEVLEERITPQATRTWVSGVGDDANPASRTAPCKTFAGAISKTAAGGEIDALDPGGFGAVTITKSITIDGSFTMAGILASTGTNGIIINAGVNDTVILRGLNINGGPFGGLNGIRILQAGVVCIQNCQITQFTNAGIDFEPANAGAKLFVQDTIIRNCTVAGVQIKPANAAFAALDHVTSELSGAGFSLQDRAVVAMSNCSASGNIGHGFVAASSGLTVRLALDNCTAANNGNIGVVTSGSGAKVSLSNVNAFGNASLGIQAAGGATFLSYSNNRITDNAKGFTPIAVGFGGAATAATRTWVSGVGDDVNPGSRTAPCKTFAGAISKTSVGGEIDVLDPGGFGGVTITKAITINGQGTFASILVTGGTNAIVINAPTNAMVVIRKISFQGAGSGGNAIRVLQAGAVFIEDCVIQNFAQAGIDFQPTNAGCQLFISNTTITKCGTFGVQLKPTNTATNTRAVLDHVIAEVCQFGFLARDGVDATFINSAAWGSTAFGFIVQAPNINTIINVDNTTSSNAAQHGFSVAGGAASTGTANLSRTGVYNNAGIGLTIGGAGTSFINSFSNIQVNFNGADGAPTGTLPQS